jgi:hypothetical protein
MWKIEVVGVEIGGLSADVERGQMGLSVPHRPTIDYCDYRPIRPIRPIRPTVLPVSPREHGRDPGDWQRSIGSRRLNLGTVSSEPL